MFFFESNKKKSMQEREMDAYGLSEEEREKVKSGIFDTHNFEEEDTEEDDYYHEDDE